MIKRLWFEELDGRTEPYSRRLYVFGLSYVASNKRFLDAYTHVITIDHRTYKSSIRNDTCRLAALLHLAVFTAQLKTMRSGEKPNIPDVSWKEQRKHGRILLLALLPTARPPMRREAGNILAGVM